LHTPLASSVLTQMEATTSRSSYSICLLKTLALNMAGWMEVCWRWIMFKIFAWKG
jgi:hypothetical protein